MRNNGKPSVLVTCDPTEHDARAPIEVRVSDEAYERVVFRIKESGFESRATEIVTMFDFIDIDEGRTPPDFSKWEAPRPGV